MDRQLTCRPCLLGWPPMRPSKSCVPGEASCAGLRPGASVENSSSSAAWYTPLSGAMASQELGRTRHGGDGVGILPALDESRKQKDGYRRVVQSFVTKGSAIAAWDIVRLERSPHAIPADRLVEVKGETYMSWTQFTATMCDGREFTFGTQFDRYFFAMPEGYFADDIVRIVPAKGWKEGEPTRPLPPDLLRDRPYFTCFVEGL